MTQDKSSLLRNKIKHKLGKLSIRCNGLTKNGEVMNLEFGFEYGDYGLCPPFVCSMRLDYSMYKNPVEYFQKEFERFIDFLTSTVNEHIDSSINTLSLPEETPLAINGLTGDHLHNVEAIEIITDRNKRIRIFQKYVTPAEKENALKADTETK